MLVGKEDFFSLYMLKDLKGRFLQDRKLIPKHADFGNAGVESSRLIDGFLFILT
jgi:hypothetical protein